MSNRSHLKELLGGPFELDRSNFLEIKSLLVLVVPQVFFLSVAVAPPGELVNFALINAAVLLTLGVFVWIFGLAWERFFAAFTIPIPLGLLIAISLGLAKVLLTISLTSPSSPIAWADPGIQSRLISGALSGVIAVFGAWLVVSKLRQFDAERSLLIEAEMSSLSSLLTPKERKDLQKLSASIREQIARLRLIVDGVESKLEGAELRSIVSRYVKPLSSSLYDVSGSTHMKFSARNLFEIATQANPPALALSLSYLLVVTRNIDLVGLDRSLAVTVGIGAFIFATVKLLARVAPKPTKAAALRFFAIAALSPIAIIFTTLSLVPGAKQMGPIEFLALAFWFSQTAVVFGMGKVTLNTAAENRRALFALGENSPALWAVKRRSKSVQMHGEVQSRLMSIALRGEAGLDISNQKVAQELESIAQLIEATQSSSKSLDKSLENLVETWSGFAAVDLDRSLFQGSLYRSELLSALIDEGVANAVRHGLASHISVSLVDNRVLLIEDDGIGPTQGPLGLGSRLFKASSDRWSLTARPAGGSRLELDLSGSGAGL